VIQALPEIVADFPDVSTWSWRTHPALLRTEGETYRLKLERMVASLGLTKHVSSTIASSGLKS